MATSKLVGLYSKDPSGRRAVVVQNLQDGVRDDNLQNYLEVICIDELTIHFPLEGCNVAIAEFASEIEDIESWQVKARKRSFQGSFLSLQMLGRPDGIFIANLPDGISEEYLSLFFENKRSGGEENTVENVKILDVCSGKHAVVEISSQTAISSILSKKPHRLRNKDVWLEPYYASVHESLTNTSKARHNTTEAEPCALEEDITCERLVQLGTAPQEQQHTSFASNTSTDDTRSSTDRTHTTRNDHCKSATQITATDSKFEQESHTFERESHKFERESHIFGQESHNHESCVMQEKHQNTYSSPARFTEPPVTFENATSRAKSDFRLKIISDDPYDDELEEQVKWPKAVSQVSHEDDDVRNYGYDPHQSKNIAAVKPVVRTLQRQLSSDGEDISSRKRKPRGRGKKNMDGQQQMMEIEEGVTFSPVQIIMLIIFRFQKKTQNDNLRVIFKEKEGKVIIKGSTVEDVTNAKVKLYECLNSVVSKGEALSPMRSTFLAREQCRNCLRARCIKQKVRAAFEVDDSKRVLKAYAFSIDDAERGLEFVKEEIIAMNIQLRLGQDKCLIEADWNSMINSLDSGLTTVYPDKTSENIIIESFVEAKAKEACGRIIHYFRQHVTKKSAEVVLESAKARCFKACLEHKLRHDVERKRGRMSVEEQSKSPFKIRILVEGEESLSSALTKIVDQIWHENVDFSKISDKAEDKWLMFRGLDGSTGTTFFRTFEKNHNCFIQVSRDGEFRLSKPRVQVEDNTEVRAVVDGVLPSTDRITEGDFELKADSDFDVINDEPEYDDRRKMYTDRHTQYLFQAGMSEQDAMDRAVEMSLGFSKQESVNFEDLVEDDIIVQDEMVDSDSLSALSRRQSELELYNRRHMARRSREHHVRRSASSPVLRNTSPVTPRSETLQIMHTTVTLIQGEIVKQKAEALVNIVSPSRSMTESVVSKAFVKLAGSQIIEMYEDARASSLGTGTVVRTGSCGRLRCSSVLHVVLKKGEAYCQQMVRQVMNEVFQECSNQAHTSVAFPPLGVGRMYKYPPETVAERMLAETYASIQSGNSTQNQITYVVFDDATYTVFEKAFKTFDASTINRHRAMIQAQPFYRQDPFQQMLHQQQPQHYNGRQVPSAVSPYSVVRTRGLAVKPLPPAAPPYGLSAAPQLKLRKTAPSALDKMFQMKRDQRQTPKPRSAVLNPESRPRHHRVSHTKSFADDTDTRQRRYKTEQDNAYREQSKRKQRRPPRSRFPDKKTASSLIVIVIATNKDTCMRARNELGKKIREEFLHEEKIDKRQKISENTKRKIVDIIVANDIESVKGKDRYILRGCKDKVAKARTDILELLLAEKENAEVKRKRKGNVKRETQDFVKYMVEEEPEVPPYWKTYRPNVTLKTMLTSVKHALTGQNYEKIELDRNDHTFSTIVKMISSTFDQSKIGQGQDARGLDPTTYSQLAVVKIQRIENLDLYQTFTGIRHKLFLRLHKSREVRFPKLESLPNCTGPIQTCRYVNSSLDKDLHPEINEVLLFHGTKKDNVGTICSSGLDPRLGSGKAMFGSGIYGAECSTKADQYADDKTSRTVGQGNTKKMFLIRMLLGNSFLCNDQNPHKYRRPPCTSCHMDDCKDTRHEAQKFGHMFDSVVGDNGKLFREFVVYDGSMCYPEYLITYERR